MSEALPGKGSVCICCYSSICAFYPCISVECAYIAGISTRYGVVENCGCPTGDKVRALFPATTGLLKQRTRQSRYKKRWVGSDASNWNADACQVIPSSSYRTWTGLDPNREDTLDWKPVSLWCIQIMWEICCNRCMYHWEVFGLQKTCRSYHR